MFPYLDRAFDALMDELQDAYDEQARLRAVKKPTEQTRRELRLARDRMQALISMMKGVLEVAPVQ